MEFFLALLGVDGGNQHSVRLDPHHGAGREVDDGEQGLADQLFGLVERVDPREDDAVGPGPAYRTSTTTTIKVKDLDFISKMPGLEYVDFHDVRLIE